MIFQSTNRTQGDLRSARALLGLMLALTLLMPAAAAPFAPRQLSKDGNRTADAASDPRARDLLRQMLPA